MNSLNPSWFQRLGRPKPVGDTKPYMGNPIVPTTKIEPPAVTTAPPLPNVNSNTPPGNTTNSLTPTNPESLFALFQEFLKAQGGNLRF